MKSFLRYVSINTKQPSVMADHYKTHFGLREVARSKDGDISLTDGWVKVSLLAHWPDTEIAGFSRYGIAVDNLDELKARLGRNNSTSLIEDQGGDHRGEYKLLDPQGMPWSVSVRDFGLESAEAKPFGVPRIRHAEISVADTHRHMEWLIGTFGFAEIHTSIKIRESGNPFPIRQVGDGVVNVTFLPFDRVPGKRMSAEHRDKKWVIQHFGWVVPDLYGLVYGLPIGLRTLWTAGGNMAEYQVHDPDGNVMDLSQDAGFEVGFDLWERGHGPGGPPARIRMNN